MLLYVCVYVCVCVGGGSFIYTPWCLKAPFLGVHPCVCVGVCVCVCVSVCVCVFAFVFYNETA